MLNIQYYDFVFNNLIKKFEFKFIPIENDFGAV